MYKTRSAYRSQHSDQPKFNREIDDTMVRRIFVIMLKEKVFLQQCLSFWSFACVAWQTVSVHACKG